MITRTREPEVTPGLALEHGLSNDEYERILASLGRTPTFTELGIISVMWSEHCSYKSSRNLLKTLPTEGPRVLQGPGENAGAISIDDGDAIVFKIESHNHPSAVEPYQGATTGVGGILRDIFTMGARPIALLNSLRFGDPKNPKVKKLAENVVRGIADYGNCVGVPTVGGEVNFDKSYEGNPLVNAMCVGQIREENLTLAAAKTVGGIVVYFGSSTGRDGVHGATFASEELTEETKTQRSAVQVGDPFMGKKILESTLELIESGVIEGIQDMGAAGLTCSSCEMGSRGGLGVRIDLDLVPARADGMSPYELMLSESQERMLAVCSAENLPRVREILGKWDLKAHEVGVVTNDGDLTVICNGEEVARLPNTLLTDEAPVIDLPKSKPVYLDTIPVYEWPETAPNGDELKNSALQLLAEPNISSKRWIFEQYDSQVQNATLQMPGTSAAVLQLKGSGKKIALATDCNGRFCYLDPCEGAKMAVAEAARNLVCAGATPLAVTNCLNFGNPNKPEVFWQFAEAIAGLGEACRILETPVTGGNVSLYNENPSGAIFPTPVIGMVGWIMGQGEPLTPFFKNEGDELWLLGQDPVTLGGSCYANLEASEPIGPCPQLDLLFEKKLQRCLLTLNDLNLLNSAQDLSEGGLFIAAAEGAMSSKIGAILDGPPENIDPALWLFSENPSRILVSIAPQSAKALASEALLLGIDARKVGATGGNTISAQVSFDIDIEQARTIYYNEQ